MNGARIRVGIGGWNFPAWRGSFYPPGLPHAQELAWASRRLSTIEVNGTFYTVFTPPVFEAWAAQVPEDFVFSLKAHMACTSRRRLAEAGPAIERFMASGLERLGPRLGPLVWSFPATKAFDPEDFAAFLRLLPREVGGLALRHVLDVRHESFDSPQYLALARAHGCATVHTDSPRMPAIADVQGPLAYLRLMRNRADCPTGYPARELAQWAQGARAWAARSPAHEVYLLFIDGDKERAPDAAVALIHELDRYPA